VDCDCHIPAGFYIVEDADGERFVEKPNEPKMTPAGEAFVRADDYAFDKMIETLNHKPADVVTECAGDDNCHCQSAEMADKPDSLERYP